MQKTITFEAVAGIGCTEVVPYYFNGFEFTQRRCILKGDMSNHASAAWVALERNHGIVAMWPTEYKYTVNY